MLSVRLLGSLLALLALQIGCKGEAGQAYQAGSNSNTQLGKIMREHTKITTSYDNTENEDLPGVIPFSDDQRKYVIEMLSAMLRVIEGTSDLGSEENMIFGDGKFFWPKDPAKPIKTSRYYLEENFRLSGITLSFERKDANSRWQRVDLAIEPRNFPIGVYDMGLPASVFRDFQLIRSAQETRPNESIHKPVVFYFSHKAIPDLTIKVEARSDLTSVDDPYPRTFHGLEIVRGPMP